MQRTTLLLVIATLLLSACGNESTIAPATAGGNLPAASTPIPGSPAAATRTALISELRNSVNARLTNAADWLTASEGEQINAGGGVRTGAESRVRIDTSDESLIRIGANTEFQLLEFSPQPTDPVTRLQLEAGKLWVQVTKALGGGSFEVETPAGVATVRGSLMSVEFDQAAGRMAVTCLEGECELRDRAQSAVRLLAGEASEIAGLGQGPLAARRITRAELQDWSDNFPEAVAVAGQWLTRLVAAETATASAPGGGATACDHPFWPMRPGATWSFTSPDGPLTWTIESVTGESSQANAVMVFTAGEVTGTYNWQCDASGIASFDFGQISSTEFGTISDFAVTRSSGVWLPPARLLTVGYAWALAYDYTAQFGLDVSAPGGSGLDTVSATSSVTQNNTVTGLSAVTFSGNSFQGVQIAREHFQTVQMQMAGISVPPTQFTDTGSWELARGIGPVRWTDTSSGVTELVSYSIP